ncbi:MAG: NfeD family protein [Aquitalea sp.]|nr:NfeD family protein [Aquitalea sp.]
MTYTLWLIGALLALIAEFMSGTFYLLVVAVALAVAGVGSLAGASEPACWLLASLTGSIGVFCVARWRARLASTGKSHATRLNDDPDLGQTVYITALLGKDMARVHYRGTEWQARLDSQHDWQVGAQAIIRARDGNILILSPTPTEAR